MALILEILDKLIDFYYWLIIIYCIFSWFPVREGGIMYDIKYVIASLVEPYLSFFRRVIPPLGGIDFSPMIAIIALYAAETILFGLLY